MANLRELKVTGPLVRGSFRAMRFMSRFLAGARPYPSDLRGIRHFLFLEYTSALGSNVHASPMFEALKRAVPDAVTMVACTRMGFDVFRHNPFIDFLAETPKPSTQIIQAIASLRKHLRMTGFVPEIVITSHGNNPRGVALLSLAAGAAIRYGHTFAPELYDFVLRYDRERCLIDNQLNVIQGLGYPGLDLEPLVAFGPDDLEHAQGLLDPLETGNDIPRVAFITQTSPTQRKSWPDDRFVSVANHLADAHRACAVFVGTANEVQGIEAIRRNIQSRSVSLAGKTTISQLAAVLSLCDYAVTLDTGNMHIGRSVGLPMVILAPAWQPVIEWLPLGRDRYRIFKGADIPKAPPDYVMDEMGSDEVIAALDDLFVRYPASSKSREQRIARSLASVSPQSRHTLAKLKRGGKIRTGNAASTGKQTIG